MVEARGFPDMLGSIDCIQLLMKNSYSPSSFEGKDRQNEVCIKKGLRDSRIRLSVPTTIQLYDLQDMLGLSLPSKVTDWLLDTTKLNIDKLPPLHFPQPCFELP
ncbi:hypothetical protein Ahy_B01g052813 [Arachis hypogaea]|uniref:TCP domain-containing protein n=1 Tax=Arachis hypogaea TaxID=3818 RepID=A0A445AQJ3_ARAHY|nr:hypothetical protein Ahy_B01g052813 [Arachis hypogaea]